MAVRYTWIALVLALAAAPVSAAPVVSTVAGTGVAGFDADGSDGPSTRISSPGKLVDDGSGGVLFVDRGNFRVRRIDLIDLTVTTVAGNGVNAPAALGAAATATSLASPVAIARTSTGDLLIVESSPGRLLRVSAGLVSLVAGNGTAGGGGDGGPATAASLDLPFDVGVDAFDNFFVVEKNRSVVRRIDGGTGVITRVVGFGGPGFLGDGGVALFARLNQPEGIALDASGVMFIADTANHRIRRVEAGVIDTIIGGGTFPSGPGTSVDLDSPRGVALEADDDLLITDDARILRGTKRFSGDYNASSVTGTGFPGYNGEGRSPGASAVDAPNDALEIGADLYFADANNHRVRRIGEPWVCGDGLVREAEGCDDGNTDTGDGCDELCQHEQGWLCVGEGEFSCSFVCGDGFVDTDAGEECEPPAAPDSATGQPCSDLCRFPVCGDGFLDTLTDPDPPILGLLNEECDDGNNVDGDGCSAGCAREPMCGDGIIDLFEDCDDGGTAAGDGCSDLCSSEFGWNCSGEPSVCTNLCGNGSLDPGETCDDGNAGGCSAACREIGGSFSLLSSARAWDLSGDAAAFLRSDDVVMARFDGSDWVVEQTLAGAGQSASSLALDGEWLLVDSSGEVDVYQYVGGSWVLAETWPGIGSFGETLALDGDLALVGEPAVFFGGRAHVYRRTGGVWFFEETLAPADGLPFGGGFAESLAISGDLAVVGAPLDPEGTTLTTFGAVYSYAFDGSSWNASDKLEPETVGLTSELGHAFGRSLGLSNDQLVVGFIRNGVQQPEVAVQLEWVGGIWTPPVLLQGEVGSLIQGSRVAIDGPEIFVVACEEFEGYEFRDDGSGYQHVRTFSLACGPDQGDPAVSGQSALHETHLFSFLTCGDGIRAPSEICDDGGTAPGDGCSAICEAEPGWTCDSGGCVLACGNGVVDAGEACDDGALDTGDGCDDVCAVEDGFLCSGEPSACVAACGNGQLDDGETCDDGNVLPGDGCDASCQIAPACGNFITEPPETCDDGNLVPGDFCDASCQIEPGCGNGVLEAGEQCDPPGLDLFTSFVTCSETCQNSICGDGTVPTVPSILALCDDGNAIDGDGCSPLYCFTESGWICSGEPSVCVLACGNGQLDLGETCDDGGVAAGDGCDASCREEAGYTCGGEPSTCVLACGNGELDPGESCDDGGIAAGDGCDASCQEEPGYTCVSEPSTCNPFCGDGLDNDGDGFIDFSSDGGCSSATGTDENEVALFSFVDVPGVFELVAPGDTVAATIFHDASQLNGRADAELVSLEFTLDPVAADPGAPETDPSILVQRLDLYVDDGDDSFDSGTDTLVTSATGASVLPTTILSLPAGLPSIALGVGERIRFWLAVTIDAAAGSAAERRLTIKLQDAETRHATSGVPSLVFLSSFDDVVASLLVVTPGSDYDGDLLADLDEAGYATSVFLPDSDFDGALDGIEVSLGTDPDDLDSTPGRLDPNLAAIGGVAGALADPLVWAEPADVDADGSLDIVAVTEPTSGSYEIYWMHNTFGDGSSFDPPALMASFSPPLPVLPRPALADLDEDGDLDLAFGSSWVRNDTGSFSPPLSACSGAGSGLFAVAADLDGLGGVDMAFVTAGGLWLCLSSGGSTPAWTPFELVSFASSLTTGLGRLVAGDLDRDGTTDVALVAYRVKLSALEPETNYIAWFAGGTGLAHTILEDPGEWHFDLALAEVDGQPRVDLVTISSEVTIDSVFGESWNWSHLPGGVFVGVPDRFRSFSSVATGDVNRDGLTESYFGFPGTAVSLVPGDIDGDGAPDLVYANATEGEVGWLRSTLTCGNGQFDPGEACDDGNAVDGDCCSATCQLDADGTSCTGGDACLVGSLCAAGVCVGGTPRVCDDHNVCTTDACGAVLGCVTEPTAGTCDDVDVCTSADSCSDGVCLGGALLPDDDGDGVCNALDDCADALDSDGDGVGDPCDVCPFDGDPLQLDSDGDASGDLCDPCPLDASDTCQSNGSAVTSIGAAGGWLGTPDGSVIITVPPSDDPDAIELPISITEGVASYSIDSDSTVLSVALGPEGATFSPPLSIGFRWPDGNSDGIVDGSAPATSELDLQVWRDGVPITGACGDPVHQSPHCAGSCCDPEANTWTLQVGGFSEFVVGRVTPQCANGLDDDGDGYVDDADPGCLTFDDPSERSTHPCDDGVDNDGDGAIDLADLGCGGFPVTDESPECQNGIDDDGDGFIDFDGGASADVDPLDQTAGDPNCNGPFDVREARRGLGCGIGFELAFAVPLLWWLGSSRRRRAPAR